MAVIVRQFEDRDYDSVKELMNQLSQIPPVRLNEEELWQLLNNSDTYYCVVVEKDREVVAFGMLTDRVLPHRGHIGEIDCIVVHEHHRGNGHMRSIMSALHGQARHRGLRRCQLRTSNERARRFYKAQGYEVSKDDVVMIKYEL